jgi:hypothetical protein
MKIILTSLDTTFKIATLDTSSGKISVFPTHLRFLRPDLSNKLIGGVFSRLDGKIICFYHVERRIFLKVGDKAAEIQDEDSVLLKYVTGQYYEFAILRNDKKIFSHAYQKPEIFPPIGMFQEEEEDFDILLFAYNILSAPDRKEHFRSRKDKLSDW